MLSRRNSTKPLLIEYGAVALMAALGVAMSVIAFLHFGKLTAEESVAAIERHASGYSDSLEDHFEHLELLGRAMSGLMSATRPASRADFQTLVLQLGTPPGLQAVAWLPRTSVGGRAALEASGRAEGLRDFAIRSAGDGEAFPVYFIEPLVDNEPYLGLDMARIPGLESTLQEARDKGITVNSGRLRLDQSVDVILVTPVYSAGGLVPSSLLKRRETLTGFVAIIVDVPKLMREAIKVGSETADLYVYDEANMSADRLVHWRPAPRAGAARPPLNEVEVVAQPHVKRVIDVGGHDWCLVWRPADADATPLSAWGSLFGGLLLTGLLSAIAIGAISRGHRAEHWAAAIDRSNEGLWREIAERRLIEGALRQAEERLQMALKSAPVSLFAHDRDLRYTWLFKSRLGLTEEEVLGRRDADVMVPGDADLLTAIKRQVLETGLPTRSQVQLQGRNGPVTLDLALEPLFEPNGTVNGLIGTAIDVTKEREAQSQLERARSEAERANEAKSRFLAAASHDLRQPLQAARLFLEVLRIKLKDHPAGDIANKAMTALEATDGLLNSLLDISTLEAGVVRPDIAVFPLSRILTRLVAEALPQAETKHLGIRAVPCSLWVRSDQVLLERMVRNLIANALRYTAAGRILIGCRRRGEVVRIMVCDTGPGIPSDKLEMIFEDFVQLGNPERDRSRGLGLGLSVVQRTARLLNHGTGVKSTPGRGASFWVDVAVVAAISQEAELVLQGV